MMMRTNISNVSVQMALASTTSTSGSCIAMSRMHFML